MTDSSATVHALRLACQARDALALAALVADDGFLVEDGGGEVAAEASPVHGPLSVARVLLRAVAEREVLIASVNGAPGLVARERGQVSAVACITVSDDLVSEIWLTINPAKLASWNRIAPDRSSPSQP